MKLQIEAPIALMFRQSQYDYSLFIQDSEAGIVTVLVYVCRWYVDYW